MTWFGWILIGLLLFGVMWWVPAIAKYWPVVNPDDQERVESAIGDNQEVTIRPSHLVTPGACYLLPKVESEPDV